MVNLILIACVCPILSGYIVNSKIINKLSYTKKQIVIGLIFGIYCILSTQFGITIEDGAIINVRDAGPLCAGLIFGMPAGIISGAIGGIYRWLCVYWGAAMYTRVACSIATIAAGLFAGLMRIRLFDDKKPSIAYGFAIGITMEVLHMLLVLLTNIYDLSQAFVYVQKCADVMIILTGASVSLSILSTGYVKRDEPIRIRPPYLIHDIGFSLFCCILVAFFCTSNFSYHIQSELAISEASRLIRLNIQDVSQEIKTIGIEETINLSEQWRIGHTGSIFILDKENNLVTKEEITNATSILDKNPEIDSNQLYRATLNGIDSYYLYETYKGYTIVGYMPVTEATYSRDVTLYLTIFMEVLVYSALYILLYQLIKKRVIFNLKKVNQGLTEITAGNLDTKINVHTHQEFVKLSNDINSTVDTLKDYIKNVENRMNKELEFARQIQHSALPNIFPPFPNYKNFDLYASMNAAKEVGGDFYDFYMLDTETLIVLMADVSGKGIPAAMFMMQTKSLIKSLVESGRSVEAAFTIANAELCKHNEADMFVTAWMAKINLFTGLVEYVNAGHNPPLIKHGNNSYEYLRERPNFVLAGMDTIRYKKHEFYLNPGDTLYLYTDGVTEAMNKSENLYTEERLLNTLNSIKNESPTQICEDVLEDVHNFADGAPQADDITMLCVQIYALQGINEIITVPTLESTTLVNEFLENNLNKYEVNPKTISHILIVMDEVYSNIVNYSQATRAITNLKITNDFVFLQFKDNGIPYNPLTNKTPDLTLSAEDRQIGGLGIFMAKKLSSSMSYKYEDEFNTLLFRFDLN